MGRGAGRAGRDGHGRGAPGGAAPAHAGRRRLPRVRLRAEAGAGARLGRHAQRPQHSRHHVGPARLLPEPARASTYNIRCDPYYVREHGRLGAVALRAPAGP